MPARIYALAKELSLDSKDLVDIVKKVGITGKGSALASLSDSEEQRVRDHIAGSAKPAEKPEKPSAAPAAVREETASSDRKPVTIVGRSVGSKPTENKNVEGTVKVAPAPIPSVTLPPVQEPAPVEAKEPKPQAPDVRLPTKPVPASPAATNPAADSTAKKPPIGRKSPLSPKSTGAPKSPSAPIPPTPMPTTPPPRRGGGLTGRVRKSDSAPVAPIRNEDAGEGRMRQLDAPRKPIEKRGDAGKSKRREPKINVRVAALPDAPAPTVKPTQSGKAQKPDIKLSKDLIAEAKQGTKPPIEKLAAEKKSSDERAKGGNKSRGGLSRFTDKRREKDGEEEKGKEKKSLGDVRRERGRRQKNVRLNSYGNNRGRGQTLRRKGTNTAAPRKDAVAIELPCTIRSFSQEASVPIASVMKVMMGMGIMGNINSEMDFETAEMIAAELDLTIELKQSETLEDEVITTIEAIEDDPDSLVTRPPIITFLGHVDHGKTSLLDYLIGIDVVSGEAGGITQHIRAYTIDNDGKPITFVDTPGHEAFTEMRARGANVTDIAVLVVAADDGIMPQTQEAISHAKAAEVPIVVAMNKIDLEGVDPNRVLTQLTEYELTPSEWGGDVEVVQTSATKGTGMDELLETILTIAELNEYTANPDRSAVGVCLEAEQQGDRGVVAKMVIQSGTLRVGDILVCGPAHGRVRAMNDTLTGESIAEAGPSTPVNLMGFDCAPGAGDRFHVLDNIGQARQIAESRAAETSREALSGITTKVSFIDFQSRLQSGNLGTSQEKAKLNLIVRADVKGSLEAIDKELAKFDHPEVELKVLQRSVGGVTLADVTLASASDAVIVAFNVIPDEQARSLADDRNIEVRRYEVIYKLTDDIKAMIEGRLKPEERVVELGRAVVKQVFSISRVGTVAGCYVLNGSVQRNCRIRVNRDGRTIGDYGLDSLKRIKEDVKEVPRGMECGIRLQGFNDIKQDDVLEAYKIEEVARTLD